MCWGDVLSYHRKEVIVHEFNETFKVLQSIVGSCQVDPAQCSPLMTQERRYIRVLPIVRGYHHTHSMHIVKSLRFIRRNSIADMVTSSGLGRCAHSFLKKFEAVRESHSS
jgi:hypothetical protein